MADRPDEARRRELRRDYKHAERTVWLAALPLDDSAHDALLEQLAERLEVEGCDHTFRLSRRWLAAQALDVEEVVERFVLLGAGCDCEVLANLDPETRA